MDIITPKSVVAFEFSNDEELLRKLQKFYTIDGYTPNIRIEGDIIHVHVDDTIYKATQSDFQKAMAYCNSGNFDKAYPILQGIIKKCPLHTDAFRVLGQIEMERGSYGKAEDFVLSALTIDPTNLWALVLMGNIYAYQGKIDVADTYYHRVLEYHPDDILALNNIAGNYLKEGKYDAAIDIFERLIERDKTYLNSYYGLALAHYRSNNLDKTIEVCVDGMKRGVDRPQDRSVRDEIQKLAMSAALNYVKDFDYRIEVGIQEKKLSQESPVPLRIEHDDKLPVHARMEYYISHHRDYNRIVYNPTKKYFEHLLMHEFMHLEMYLEASKVSLNKIVISGSEELSAFRKWIMPELGKIRKQLTADHFERFIEQMQNGLMLQAINSPLDLLVEDRIYQKYPKMRPLQMLSLVGMEMEYVQAVEKGVKSGMPKKLVSANRIMNVVSAMHLQELYGFNIVPHYKATPNEMAKAKDLYEEYKAYREDYKPGEEYDLMEYFTETLGLDKFFTLVNEMHFREISLPPKETLPDECIDPNSHEEQNAAFVENHKDGDDPAETMMMTMYMLGALQYMHNMPHEDIHRIALEIAVVGMQGINPSNKGYSIQAIPDKEFGGYEFLAYYYVSWALAIPEKLPHLGLPFSKAYEAALHLYNSKNRK